jgi:excisionase family DNA binding protein
MREPVEIAGEIDPDPSSDAPKYKVSNEPRTISVPEAGRWLGIGRNAAYDAARRGEIPTIRIGRLLRVPVVALERMLAR